MARIRTVKPEFWTDSKTGTLSDRATKLFLGMLNYADDLGVITYNLDELRVKIFPYAIDVTTKVLGKIIEQELLDKKLLKEFKHNGVEYLWVCNFLKHQKINRPSTALYLVGKEVVGALNGGSPTTHVSLTDSSLQEGIGKEGRGEESKGGDGEGSVEEERRKVW